MHFQCILFLDFVASLFIYYYYYLFGTMLFRISSETIREIAIPLGTHVMQVWQNGKSSFIIDRGELDEGHLRSLTQGRSRSEMSSHLSLGLRRWPMDGPLLILLKGRNDLGKCNTATRLMGGLRTAVWRKGILF